LKDNYYAVLGIMPRASQDEIRAAYKKLARQYHPDVNQGSKDSEEKFKLLLEAYQTLSDPRKKDLYDLKLSYKLATQKSGAAQTGPPTGPYKTSRQREDDAYRMRRPAREAYREYTGPPKKDKLSPHMVAITLFATGTLLMIFLWLGEIMNHITAKDHLERGDFNAALLFDDEYGEAYYARYLSRKAMNANPKILLFDLNLALRYMENPSSGVYMERAMVYFRCDSLKKSIADYEKALAVNPACDTACYALGEIYAYILNDPKKALDWYEASLRIRPQSYSGRFGKALMLYRLQRFASCIREFDICSKQDRSDKRLFFYRGSARLAMGDSAAACFDLDQSLTMGMDEAKPMVDRFCRKFGY